MAGTLYCCECNLCSLVACPEALDPKNVCVEFKKDARKKSLKVESTGSSVLTRSKTPVACP